MTSDTRGMITLVALICLGPLCQDVVVPTESLAAGKVDAPVSMPFTYTMCETKGLSIAVDWLALQQQFHDWRLVAVECVPGAYVPRGRA